MSVRLALRSALVSALTPALAAAGPGRTHVRVVDGWRGLDEPALPFVEVDGGSEADAPLWDDFDRRARRVVVRASAYAVRHEDAARYADAALAAARSLVSATLDADAEGRLRVEDVTLDASGVAPAAGPDDEAGAFVLLAFRAHIASSASASASSFPDP